MKIRVLCIIIGSALASVIGLLQWWGHAENTAEKANLAANYGKIPLHFEENAGQVNEQVKFLARGNGYSLFLTSDEAVMALRNRNAECGVKIKIARRRS